MNNQNAQSQKMTQYRWVICGMLFLATTINYMDRQVLSLTWKDFIAPDFHWSDTDYGNIAAVFAIAFNIKKMAAKARIQGNMPIKGGHNVSSVSSYMLIEDLQRHNKTEIMKIAA